MLKSSQEYIQLGIEASQIASIQRLFFCPFYHPPFLVEVTISYYYKILFMTI
jgi:hypothetical protein